MRADFEHLNLNKMGMGPLRWDMEQNSIRQGTRVIFRVRGSNMWWWKETRLWMVSTQSNIQMIYYRMYT